MMAGNRQSTARMFGTFEGFRSSRLFSISNRRDTMLEIDSFLNSRSSDFFYSGAGTQKRSTARLSRFSEGVSRASSVFSTSRGGRREPTFQDSTRPGADYFHSGEIDFNKSISAHDEEQRISLAASVNSRIDPMPAEGSTRRDKIGKKVCFALDVEDKASKTKSVTLGEGHYFIGHKFLDEKALKYSLVQKDMEGIWSAIGSEGKSDKDGETTEGSVAGKGISLEGALKAAGPSEFYMIKQDETVHDVEASQNVIIPDYSFLAADVWPWPWLNPDLRAKVLYRTHPEETFENQGTLPMLPVPVLAYSLNRFLHAVKPCLRENQFADTKKVVEEFALGKGKLYQEHMLERCQREGFKWINEFLPNYSHCYSRIEAPLMNRGIIAPFMHDLWPEKANSQLDRAAILIELVVEFWQLIWQERLTPIMDDKDHLMCMHQFRHMFSSTKLPGIPCDAKFSYFQTQDEDENGDTPRNIIVMYKGLIFSFEVMDTAYTPMPLESIRQHLGEIVRSTDEGTTEANIGLGILTSLDRNMWSEARWHLAEISEENAACLNEIERAMFVLSLDSMSVVNGEKLPHEALFADGYNRWYDKGLSFYVYKNGLITVNVNTSIMEASTVAFLLHYMHLRIMEDAERWDDDVVMQMSKTSANVTRVSSFVGDLLHQVQSRASYMSDTACASQFHRFGFQDSGSQVHLTVPVALTFELDKYIREGIDVATEFFDDLSSSLTTGICKFDHYERGLFKEKHINPDAFAHLVMHLTFYKMYYRFASIANKISLKRFHHGRYEFMRSTTQEAVDWCKIMEDPLANEVVREEAFWKAIKKHVALVNESASGRGFENHLAALHVIGQDHFNETPQLFEESELHLSAGGLAFDIVSETLAVGCPSAPVVTPCKRSGYGVGYFVADTKIVFTVCSWEDEPTTSAPLYASSLHYTMKCLHGFLKYL